MEQMTHYAHSFLRRKKIAPADIRYLIRTGAQTELHLLNGRTLNTYIGLKAFSDALPKEDFLRINKGVLLAKSQIVKIYRGTYLTTDGKSFTGRTHDPIQHKTIMKELAKSQARHSKEVSAELNTRFSVLDIMPASFCVIELVFDEKGKETTFIFRYCNDSMGELSNQPVAQMMNHSFYDIFENADERWLPEYAEIAINGGSKVLHGYSRALDRDLSIYCFQPEKGFCACLLIDKATLA